MQTRRASSLVALFVLPHLLLAACSETSERDRIDSGAAGKLEMVIFDETLNVLEVRFLKGRCLGRVSVDSQDSAARSALVSFVKALEKTIPLDGSKPATDDDLKALIPASGAIDNWQEDPADTTKGPWLITTDAFSWINGSGKPFADNGFEAVAGEAYVLSGQSWKLELELVNQGSTTGAEAAFRQSFWDQGKPI